jgi:hypothetical protein
MRAHFHGATTKRRRRRRAGDDARATRASFVVVVGEAEASPPLKARSGAVILRTRRLFHVRGLAERVWPRCPAVPSLRSIPLDAVNSLGRRPRFHGVGTAVGWAVLLVSTSIEVCVARERARRRETHRSHRQACLAPYHAARGVSAACARPLAAFWLPCVFCVFLRVTVLVFSAGLARGGCRLRSLFFWGLAMIDDLPGDFYDPKKAQIGKFGFSQNLIH